MGEKKRIKKEKKKKKNRPAVELNDEEKPQTSNPSRHSSDELKPDKKKRKKKVSFELSPGVIWSKRPKFIPSSSQHPKESVLLEDAAAAASTATGQTHDDDSQLNSEDINSQDLFITQKTFRASPSEPSSCEASDEVIPRTLSPQVERHLKGAYERPRESQRDGKTTLLIKEEKVPCPPLHAKPRVVTPLLDDTIDETPSLQATESKTSTSTQTENLFTTELSSYLNFCRRVAQHSDDLKPLDLSLPQRARKDFGTSVKINHEDPNPHPLGAKGVVVKKEPSSHRRSLSTRGKSQTSPTLQSDSDTSARAVQTKLNESFFFKTKGDGQSPRPESPLMKLAQGRDATAKKGRVKRPAVSGCRFNATTQRAAGYEFSS
ncbi:hypothetical protein GBF38_020875 [Nibea albiflora]|uniref:Uncharacterized protein n=1 Tax=Nibea albiflora TaxID=240163 RepID=A0ACB7FFV9_NIBAL|nr:hypothetical protein GBF38_020875 [Nibea albiflora]